MSKSRPEILKHVDLVERYEPGQFLEHAKVDRKDNRIRDVKLCGKHSKNGRIYTDRALTDAVRLYEGAPFYLDHPTDNELRARKGVRSVLDLAGKIENARKVGESVRGDIVLLDKEPSKALVFAIAEQMPEMAGNSHRASGTVRRENGMDIVESLDDVMGIELVTDPATTSGLFESVNGGEEDMDKLTLEKLRAERPDLVEALYQDAGVLLEASRLGSFIRAQLGKKDMDVAELASKIGIEAGTMSSIISGEIARPPDARLERMAKALGVSFQSLRRLVGDESAGGPGSLPVKKESGESMITIDDYTALQEKYEALEKKVDAHEAKDKLGDQKTLIAEKLKKADLPKALVTEFFQKQLEHAEDEKAIDALIADRSGCKPKGGATSTERTIIEQESGDKKPVDEANLVSIGESLGVI